MPVKKMQKNFHVIQWFWLFIRDIYDKRYTIYELTKRDFKTMYTGSLLGLTWSFIQPLTMIAIMWFVFTMGFKTLPVENVPFVVWLFLGLVPWYFFSNCLSTNTSVLFEYAYLIKKTNFRVSILPIVKILSALIVHGVFLGILLVLLLIYRLPLSVYWLQVFYYALASSFFLLGLSWITSSVTVFLKDMAQIVSILVQFGFWLTPVFWNISILPEQYLPYVKLNPMLYIIQGYRNSIIYQIPFWQDWGGMCYFWGLSFVTALAGIIMYKRLRPHFADVI